jgi:hypothetical protein
LALANPIGSATGLEKRNTLAKNRLTFRRTVRIDLDFGRRLAILPPIAPNPPPNFAYYTTVIVHGLNHKTNK